MRAIFEVNRVLDRAVLKPAAILYKDFLPPPVQRGIYNVLNNLRSPLVFFNDLLQGKPDRAGTTLARFFINSTVGILGVRDQATEWGFEPHNEDFGQTLATWGAGEGPYLMLPVFGPSNPRDAVGLVIDYIMDPFTWWANATDRQEATLFRGGLRAVGERARNFDLIEDLERTSLDYYATVRSLYRQRRRDEIDDGRAAPGLPMPGFGQWPGVPAAGQISQVK